MRNNYPEIVCWRITSKCNRRCPFCFRSDGKDLNTKNVYKIIDKLASSGVSGIGVTGGEPLLRKNIAEILKYIWDKNIKICLATNADFYHRYKSFLNNYASTIGLPIEGSTSKIHDSLRGTGSFQNVLAAIGDIYNRNKLQMYFSTVLTKKNIDNLANIEILLAEYKDKIVYWKIYDIVDYSDRQFQSIKDNKISKIEIKKTVKALGKKIGRDKIFYLSPDDRSEASLIINPNGEVLVPINKKTKTKDFILGNLVENEANEMFERWSQLVDYDKYRCHKCALRCVRLNE